MASFPTSIATLTNPLATDKMNVVLHSVQHGNANDEIEAIETALGVNMGNVMPKAYLDTDPLLAADSDTKVPSQKAVKAYADAIVVGAGALPASYLDTDGTLAANSDTKIPSQKAVKTYTAGYIGSWFAVAAAGGYTITHGLGTQNLLISIFFSPNGGTTRHLLCNYFDPTGTTYGACVTNITTTQLTVRTCADGVHAQWNAGVLSNYTTGHYLVAVAKVN